MKTIIALQPQSRHMGYAVFEGAELVDWGITSIGTGPMQDRVSRRGMSFIRDLIDRHHTKLIILPVETRRRGTVQNHLLRAIKYSLTRTSIQAVQFHRRDMNKSFEQFLKPHPVNREAIMRLLTKWFPELLPSLPQPKRRWESKNYWVPMFDAIALVVTWHHHHK